MTVGEVDPVTYLLANVMVPPPVSPRGQRLRKQACKEGAPVPVMWRPGIPLANAEEGEAGRDDDMAEV